MKRGWHGESARHSLAARGIRSKRSRRTPSKSEIKYRGIKKELEEFEERQRRQYIENIIEALGELDEDELREVYDIIGEALESPRYDFPEVNGGYVSKLRR